MELGKLIRDRGFTYRNPYFKIRERGTECDRNERDISPDMLGKMIREGKFAFRNINVQLENQLSESEIWLHLNDDESYLISGFPRCLFQDEKVQKSECNIC